MAAVMAGRVAPEVKQIALIQPTPFVVTALDENGSVLGSISW